MANIRGIAAHRLIHLDGTDGPEMVETMATIDIVIVIVTVNVTVRGNQVIISIDTTRMAAVHVLESKGMIAMAIIHNDLRIKITHQEIPP